MRDFCEACGMFDAIDLDNGLCPDCMQFTELVTQDDLYTPELIRTPTLYGGYGANTNFSAMASRCPGATFEGVGTLSNWRLEFRGVADIAEAPGHSMDIAIWTITRQCERSLDRFEGYPRLYGKRTLTVDFNGEPVDVMFYTMQDNDYLASPPKSYYECLHEGYGDCGMNLKELYAADGRAMRVPQQKPYKSRNWG